MEEMKLDVQIRNEGGTRHARKMRREDYVPGVVYGGQKKSTLIKLNKRTYERIRRQHIGESVVYHLNVFEGEKKLRDYSAIVKEEQLDPVNDDVLHIDFKRISLTEKIEINVQVVAKGDPIGVKRGGGSLDHHLWELDVICLPLQIPHHIEVEVSNLDIGDSIHVKDLVLPAGVSTKHDPEALVMTVVPPMKEVEPVAAAAAPTEPEVIKEKKDKEGAAEEKKPAEAQGQKEEKKEAKKDAKKE